MCILIIFLVSREYFLPIIYFTEHDLLLSSDNPIQWRRNDADFYHQPSILLCALILVGAGPPTFPVN